MRMQGWCRDVAWWAVRSAALCGVAAVLAVGAPAAGVAAEGGRIPAVAAESQYANVLSQIGGPYVAVTAIMSNPNTDPHTYEASTADAAAVARARLVIQNGLGYDAFMDKLEAASPNSGRIVLTVATAVGDGPHTLNPHIWYAPATMPRLASRIAADLSRLEPAHARYFRSRAAAFRASLGAWDRALARLRRAYARAPVAVTEPVADDLLTAADLDIRTPWAFQAAVMNGTDPSPQDVAIESGLIQRRVVRVLVYNQQAVDAATQPLLALAQRRGVPVVGVYELMPPHETYQGWMLAETRAIMRAIGDHQSTVKLP
jgi:zinc/manganese transport system substrate-binding protein